MNTALRALLDLAIAAGFTVTVRGRRADVRRDGRLVAVVDDPVEREQVTTAEAAELLGVSRQRVLQLRDTHDDFPRPVDGSGRSLWWSRAALLQFDARRRAGELTPAPDREAS